MADRCSPAQRCSTPCCCGRHDCQVLLKNARVIDSLEKDVKQAATMGQALLIRHEAFMADAERDRTEMSTSIERLEQDKLDLELQNAKTIQENRDLLGQLEELNDALAESDTHVKSLEATLESTQLEMKRLQILAARTESLERQLDELEREQAQLHDRLNMTEEDKVSAIQRWHKAERTIANLQDSVDRIEREARQERERHIDIVGRMEKRRAVEKELETAAGRLKGAAAIKTGNDKAGSNVVSHFVKDILQDNANLQLGIVELREMLMNSNEEVERLREEVILHQPVQDDGGTMTPTLDQELGIDRNPELHLHVHHHVQRRIKKANRKVVTPAHFQSPVSQASSASHTPRTSISRLTPNNGPSSTAILQHTSVTIPYSAANQRWSVQSNQTGTSFVSSMPGSPHAHSRRPSSLFDRVFSEAAYDSSRPTSPESSTFASPNLTPMKGYIPNDAIEESELDNPKPIKRKPPSTIRNFTSPLPLRTVSAPRPITALTAPVVSYYSTSADPSFNLASADCTIVEEAEHEQEQEDTSSVAPSTDISTTDTDASPAVDENMPSPDFFAPSYSRLRRATSHDSLLSISGMDIHAYPHSHGTGPHALLSSSPSISSSTAVLTAHLAQANLSTTRLRGKDSRSLLTTMHRQPSTRSTSASTPQPKKQPSSSTLSQRVGGWISGKWGSTPQPSSSTSSPTSPETPHTPSPAVSVLNAEAAQAAAAATLAAAAKLNVSTRSPLSSGTSSEASSLKSPEANSVRSRGAGTLRAKQFQMRSPGINQPGPMFFAPETPAPSQIEAREVDVEALGEALAE